MSGLGREGGAEGIHEYLQTKYTLTPTRTHERDR
jgi:succinate-semialdehyde dehydrogenase/glutarate-semialdehyde dehydrogenase